MMPTFASLPASLLVFLIPLVAAVPAWLFRRWRSAEILSAMAACGLAIALLSQPATATIPLPGLSIEVGGRLDLLGRALVVQEIDRLPLVVLFASALVLFGLSWRLPQGRLFVPLGLGILALVCAGLMIRPFVFAALAFEAAAAMAAVMIQAERMGPLSTVGAQRYLALNTLALPAFLGAGYVIGQALDVADPALQSAALQPAALLLALGFALLAGALPLYTWIHAVAGQSPPLVTAFLATVAAGAATFLFLEFKQQFDWFRASADAREAIHLLGLATLLLGGLIAWAQRSWGRLLACALSVDLGVTVLMLNHETPASVEAVAFAIVTRSLSLGLFGAGLSVFRACAGSDDFASLRGAGRRYPLAALAVALGAFSIAGFPGTLGFVVRWLNARVLSGTDLEVMMITLLAGVSIGWGALRGLFSLLAEAPAEADDAGRAPSVLPRGANASLLLGAVVIVALGLAPGLLAGLARAVAAAYTFYR